MSTKIYHDPDWLNSKYWDEGLSTGQVADLGGCSAEQIRYWMIKHNISRRRSGEACSLRWRNDPALRQWRSEQVKASWEQGCFEGRFTEEVIAGMSEKAIAAHARGCYDEAHERQGDLIREAFARGAYDNRINNSSDGVKAAHARGVYDHVHNEEWRRKVSIAIKAAHARGVLGKTGEDAANWRGGLSFEPYPPTFNETFKRMIRVRDNYKCAICRLPGKDVHHIDYIKENTVPKNCITLCHSCHSTTNFNREYWQRELSNLIYARGIGL